MDYASSLTLIAPEITLGASGLILLLVAAWGGDKAARLVTYGGMLALFGAGVLALGARRRARGAAPHR